MTATDTLDSLNSTYAALHTSKEDAFWSAYMGLTDDSSAAREDLDAKEIELKRLDCLRRTSDPLVERFGIAGPRLGAVGGGSGIARGKTRANPFAETTTHRRTSGGGVSRSRKSSVQRHLRHLPSPVRFRRIDRPGSDGIESQ